MSTSSRLYLAYHWVGTMMCFSAIVVFSSNKFANPRAVLLCILAFALSASASYILTVSYLKKLESWYSLSSIGTIRDFGMCVGVIMLGLFAYVIFEISYYGWDNAIKSPVKESKIILAVWCFISAKYAFTIFWLGRKYFRNLSDTRLFLEE
uniref:Cationic amino acid transporter 4 n=1 Tax=Lygus hesperus TaxID=30085 RepID=A0A0A9YB10_LYGHE